MTAARVPDQAPDPTPVDALLAIGAHLLPLKPGLKEPVQSGWPDAAPLSRDAALAHVAGGGGLGVNVGRSGLIVLDAENAIATSLLVEMGFVADVETANSQVVGGKKFGGRHFYLKLPDGVPDTLLKFQTVDLDGAGAKMDFLAGQSRYAVTAPTTLDASGGFGYRIIAGSPLASGALPVAPAWLFDRALTAPTDAGTRLREAVLRAAEPKPVWVHDDASDELTEAIDRVAWEDWLAGDPRLSDTGMADSDCGCGIFHWHTADNAKSVTLHDGCSRGKGFHAWSGTMRTDLGIDEHGSRLTLAAAMQGVTESEAAAGHGITLGRRVDDDETIYVLSPDGLDDAAAEMEAKGGDADKIARFRDAAETMRENIRRRVPPTEMPTFRVSGATALAPVIDIGTGAQEADMDTVETDADAEGDSALAEAFAALDDPYAPELEEAVFGFLPQTRAIRDAARNGAVSPWSVLGITIGRGLLRVSPSVVIPSLVGNSAAPLNLQIGIVGKSGRGKGIAGGIVDYDTATAQGWDQKFQPPSGAALANLFVAKVKGDDGEFRIEQIREAAWCDWSEVDTLTATTRRGGNDLAGQLRVAISGAELGTDPKGEGQLPLKVAAMVYRMLVSMSTQYGEPAAALMAERDGGTLQRTVWFGTSDPRRLAKRPRGVPAWAQLSILQKLPQGQLALTVDEEIHDEVWEAQSDSIKDDTGGDELGGHHYLNRLKLAAWAALIQFRSHIGRAEWDWAGAVMVHSDRIRARLDASVRNLKIAQAREFGELDTERREAGSTAAAVKFAKLVDGLDQWGADHTKGPKHKKEKGLFTLRDVQASAGSRTAGRYVHAEKLCAALVEAERWGSDGTYFWVLGS